MADEKQTVEQNLSEEKEIEANAGAAPESIEDPENADLFFELADEAEESSEGNEAMAEKEAEPADSASEEQTVPSAEESAADAATDEKAGQSAGGKEKKLFGKKKEKAKSQMELKIAELEEQRVRQLAEFENFRKRSEREKSQMFEMGAKDVIEKILPVIDNFERGLMGVPEEQKEEPFVQGMELVYKQILTTFEALGVQPIEAVGKEFDPAMHNAVMAVDDDSLESGTVAEELQKGYLYKDSVVRHSMVKVVN